ncbi:MAG: UDP-2,3-diacylglucosamine diphosphatase [Pseudomonadota bacterium]
MEALRIGGQIDCETLWISDIHLGNIHCKAGYLLQLLQRVHCKRLYLVGDIVDVWTMQRRVHWPQAHSDVVAHLQQMSREGVEVIYVPGNHDRIFRDFNNTRFGNFVICEKAYHMTANGRRLLVVHGDELDEAVRYSRVNRVLGDFAYALVMSANRMCHRLRATFGQPYWSLAGWIKLHVARAEEAIGAFESAAIALAEREGVDGIVCGHLHHPALRQCGGVLYCNDGDWVENCTAVIEDAQGELHLLRAIGSCQAQEPVLLAFS